MQVPVGIYHLTPGDREVMLPELKAIKDKRLKLLEQGTTNLHLVIRAGAPGARGSPFP